ncbi:aquaporin AQPAe.a [Lingula anatina]|uniref:Aquaporin AQPAe.a n=1 Tax=Lingula anatina TaxID=7574 RepID=A0A1S3H7R6_LINAN|nr:aquaporin AQPAe.a [Lingula anatina]XP_013382160.1 aquaporin AQPAe.a [Lingula anatina]|eukprot:XP_013382159.1 aquaporin AQPAe.a [Lingula anatina]
MAVRSLQELTSLGLYRSALAEFVGTLFLVFVACGSVTGRTAPSIVQVAFTFGLSVATVVWAIAHVSGGHVNPAVTVAMVTTRRISVARAVLYVIMQLLGAAAGAGLLKAVVPYSSINNPRGLGVTTVDGEVTAGQALGIEFLITFVLVFTVFATCDGRRSDLSGSGPLAIGLSVTMCHLFAIQYTGSSMNTARSFGPALVQGEWSKHWIYWFGPILGGMAAGLLYDFVFAADACKNKFKQYLTNWKYDPDTFSEPGTGVKRERVPSDVGDETAEELNRLNSTTREEDREDDV